jgi:hypothetical protein
LAIHGRIPLAASEVERVAELLASDEVSPRDRASLHLVQAGLLDQQGCFEKAFEHYRRSSDLRRELLKAQGHVFDPQEHWGLVEKLVAQFDRQYFGRVATFGVASDFPVFIVGMPRSGTTLVEQILASHPQVVGGGELKEIRNIVSDLPAPYPGDNHASVWINREQSQVLAEQYLRRLSVLGGEALRVTDKMFDNYLRLGVIFTLFPRARVIHCRRDPIDACFSCYSHDFRGTVFTTALDDLAHYYRAYAKLMAHWRSVLPQPMLDVDYEELVASQERESRRLVAFCGLDWDERCLDFHTNRRAVLTASRVQIRRPIYIDSVGRWKNYEPYLAEMIGALAN